MRMQVRPALTIATLVPARIVKIRRSYVATPCADLCRDADDAQARRTHALARGLTSPRGHDCLPMNNSRAKVNVLSSGGTHGSLSLRRLSTSHSRCGVSVLRARANSSKRAIHVACTWTCPRRRSRGRSDWRKHSCRVLHIYDTRQRCGWRARHEHRRRLRF